MDDKHCVKIGEPGYPAAAIERGKEVPVAKGTKLMVGDHDLTKLLMTPSVILTVNIPEKVKDSFYRGKVCVGTTKPILAMYTYGTTERILYPLNNQ